MQTEIARQESNERPAKLRSAHAVPPRMLNATQAARLLGIGERTLHDLRKRGLIPEPMRLGPRALRWDRVELVEHLRQHAPRGTAPEPAQLVAARRARAEA